MAGDPPGKLSGKRVRERGKSECRSVMERIGLRTLPRCEKAQTSTWCGCRRPISEVRLREAWKRLQDVQFSALVSAMGWTNEMAFAKVLCSLARPVSTDDALAVLEPFAVKVAWTVLWGGGGSDALSLPAYSARRSSTA